MYIKQIIISGFKSFRDQTIVDPFSPRHNIIVGSNGSGKSNFFFAIRFVLSDHFTHLSTEERQRLLHEGAGSVLSAYVEIVFDNSSGRIPVDSDEVIIRRTIGVKKDEYSLARKTTTRNDVFALLEAAGFSRSHPYYIVQQGKVEALATMSDAGRLKVLHEVAGSASYDQRREESVKILESTRISRTRIDESLSRVEERLEELSSEKSELDEFTQLDKQRKALEFALLSKTLSGLRASLDSNDVARRKEAAKVSEASRKGVDLGEQLRVVEQDLVSNNNKLRGFEQLIKDLEDDKNELVRKKAQLQLDVDQNTSLIASRQSEKQRIESELERVNNEIAINQNELDDVIRPQLEAASNAERDLIEQKQVNQAKIDDLIAKSGRKSQFKSKKHRDNWLTEQLQKLSENANELKKKKSNHEKEIAGLTESIDNFEGQINQIEVKIEDQKRQLAELSNNNSNHYQEKTNLISQVKDYHRQEGTILTEIETVTNLINKEKRELGHQMPKGVSKSLDILTDASRNGQISGFFGPVIDLFRVDPAFFPAVEAVAKNQLFHVVVADADVASQCISLLKGQNSGRLTFIPLNNLNPKEPVSLTSEDYFPLLSRFDYDSSRFKQVFDQIFGRSLLCRDIELAVSLSTEHRIDCVTIEGDLVARKGPLTGGHLGSRPSRLSIYYRLNEHISRNQELKNGLEKVRNDLKSVEVKLDRVSSSAAAFEHQKSTIKSNMETLFSEKGSLRAQVDHLSDMKEAQLAAVSKISSSLTSLHREIDSYTNELGTPLSHLSSEEEGQLEIFKKRSKELERLIGQATTKKSKFESKSNSLTSLLNSNLYLLKTDLEAQLIGLNSAITDTLSIKEIEIELESIIARLGQIETRLSETRQEESETKSKLTDLENQKETLTSQVAEYSNVLESEGSEMTRLLTERATFVQKRDEAQKKLKDLGAVNMDMVNELNELEINSLNCELTKVNVQLKKYSHVNRKALEQFILFTSERDTMVGKREELIDGENSINDLIIHLDAQKDDCLKKTFESVKTHFSAVFSEIVPNGNARIETLEDTNNAIIGLTVKVSFTGQGDVFLMEQLSGGQKAVVALSLIFAIQRTEMAPFYLFDELDAALDDNHRFAVAQMIQKMSIGSEEVPGCQVISTTFRPELIEVGDQHYVISLRNKVSTIRTGTVEECLDVIRDAPVDNNDMQ
ncbi:hypothetical protein P9112_014586 [Eukaryota sp. TZLM1-RC]